VTSVRVKTVAVQQNTNLFHVCCSIIVLDSESIDGPAINAKPISYVELIWTKKWPEGKELYLTTRMSSYEEALAKYDADGKLPNSREVPKGAY